LGQQTGMWTALFLTLPTQPNAVRLRLWRSLKTLGCAALRDGVHLLPREHAALFDPLIAEAQAHGGQAAAFDLSPRSPGQAEQIRSLFDRSAAYAAWRGDVQTLIAALHGIEEADARRRLRGVADALQALRRIDYHPGAAAEQAQAQLAALRAALEARFSTGEPVARAAHGIARLDPRAFRGKRWATRARPWVDRLACAWLIRRFVDPDARFVWLADPAKAPRGVLGFDFDGARFTHTGARVSFEVLAASFGFDADPRLARIAQAVHYLDVGGIPVPEAAGLEAVLAGLRALHSDDDALAAATAPMFDALYAAPGAPA
jgi:hypothetical protein